MKIPFSQVILKYLQAEGVEYVFGVPGATMVPLMEAFRRSSAVKPIVARHEAGAAFMADGYARVKGCLGACFSGAGSGATNLVTGVATSCGDDVPLLVMTGQVDTTVAGKGAFQDSSRDGVDSVKMFEPVTRRSAMTVNPYRAVDDLQTALRAALTGRKGPAHFCIPRDILASDIEFDAVAHATYRFPPEYFDRRLVIEATEFLVGAKHPAILVGSGAVRSGACDEVRELAEMLSIPVATTPKAKGAFPEDHPLALGVAGLCGSPLAENYLKSGRIDVLLVVGASLNQITTLAWDPRLRPTRALVHVNIDPAEIGKNYATEVPLVGDARTIMAELGFRALRHITQLEGGVASREPEVAEAREQFGRYTEPAKMAAEDAPIKPQRLMSDLQACLPDDAILFVDAGNTIAWAIHYLDIKRPGSFITPFGLPAMGHGISAAIGGKLAAPDRPVIALAGDGGFLIDGMEIATAVAYDIPVVFIIMRTQELGPGNDLLASPLGDRTAATRLPDLDVARIAEGLGALAFKVAKPGELQQALPRALASKRTCVIECAIDPSEAPPIAQYVSGQKDFVQRLHFG